MMNTLRRKRLIDRVMDAYIDWRTASARVSDAYRAWALDTGSRDPAAFGLYIAALDAEEQAAEVYATVVRDACKRLWGEGSAAEAPDERTRGVARP